MGQLDGVRALITGGSSGLGLAMARALAGAGATVVLTSRDGDRARKVARSLTGRAHGIELDVRNPSSVDRAVDAALAELGAIDLLIGNAGIGMRTVNPRFITDPEPFWRVSPDGFNDVLLTKATGSFLVARAVVGHMLRAGTGRIVTISMNHSTMQRRGFVPYGPSGAAVEALGRVIAADLADTPVRANLLLPGGATRTGMVPDSIEPDAAARLLDPEIMGPPIVWLASPAAADVHDERIVATEFEVWLAARSAPIRPSGGRD
ncbi:MAG TPA: SDR family oxidoreductase [Solirubrobacteraceae bacterium]|jgi:gluconate 5-dehydrogenase